MAKRIISSKIKYSFTNKISLATTYCTPKELQLNHAIPSRELRQLLKGEISKTSKGWEITS